MTDCARRRLIVAASLISAILLAVDVGAQGPDDPPLTLQSALAQARLYSQPLLTALTSAQMATEDRVQARAALLPSVNGFTQYIHTQPNGTPSGVFVSNDGPQVYNTWANAHADIFAPQKWADYRASAAAEAVARARADVATRGLVATVVQNYYGLVAAGRKVASAQQSLAEATQFLDITGKQEQAGEVAHADVVKAQIQVAQRQRDAQDAELAALKARLALSVLVFPDFRDRVSVVDDLQVVVPPPPLDAVKSAAASSNPDLRVAQATVDQERSSALSAKSAFLPSVSFDYFYGINANQFAAFNPDGERLLGSAWQAQATVPLWNWGASQSKLRQAQLRVRQAQSDLTLTERQLLANVNVFHAEAQTAFSQVDSLRASRDLAAESLRLTLLRYQAGEVTALEAVDAQTTLVQARIAYDDGLVRYRVALAALQTLTGSLP